MPFGRSVSLPRTQLVCTVDYGHCTLIQLVAAAAAAAAETCRMKSSNSRRFVRLC